MRDARGRVLASHGLDAVGLRYFTVYGPRQRPDMGFARFIEAALRGEELPLFGDGRQLRDFTYVGDVVARTIAAAELVTRARSTTSRPAAAAAARRARRARRAIGQPLAVRLQPAPAGESRDTWRPRSPASTRLRADDPLPRGSPPRSPRCGGGRRRGRLMARLIAEIGSNHNRDLDRALA